MQKFKHKMHARFQNEHIHKEKEERITQLGNAQQKVLLFGPRNSIATLEKEKHEPWKELWALYTRATYKIAMFEHSGVRIS